MEHSSGVCLCIAIVDGILFLSIVFGNALTILAIKLTRRLRSMISSYFILSLAISDLMVGLTLPYRILFNIGDFVKGYKVMCLLKFTLSSFTCCASVCNVTAIAVDRYLAIVYPLKYTKFMTQKRACVIILIIWVFSFIVASMPLYWNKYQAKMECQIENVMPRIYLLSILFPALIIMWLIIIFTNIKIGSEAKISVQKLKLNNMDITLNNDKKSIQVVLLILICFSLCWIPFMVVAFMRIYHWNTHSTSVWYEVTFSFVLTNSGMNPLIYAWKNTKFRRSLHRLLRCQLPDKFSYLNSSKNYFQRGKKSITNESQVNHSQPNTTGLQIISDLYLSENKIV